MKFSANVILSYFIVFGLGIGVGWLLTRGEDEQTKAMSAQVKDAGNPKPQKVASGEISLKTARDFRILYTDFDDPFNKPGTECVVHGISELKGYIAKIEKEFEGYNIDSVCRGGKLGIALYIGKAYEGNYLQHRSGQNSAYLLEDNYTVFLMPVLYNEKKKNIPFRWVYDITSNTVANNQTRTVDIINCFYSPLDYTSEEVRKNNSLFKLFKNILNDPQGFDLGHTHP